MTRDDINLLAYGICDLFGLTVAKLAAKRKALKPAELESLTSALLDMESLVQYKEQAEKLEKLREALQKHSECTTNSAAADAVAAALAFGGGR